MKSVLLSIQNAKEILNKVLEKFLRGDIYNIEYKLQARLNFQSQGWQPGIHIFWLTLEEKNRTILSINSTFLKLETQNENVRSTNKKVSRIKNIFYSFVKIVEFITFLLYDLDCLMLFEMTWINRL